MVSGIQGSMQLMGGGQMPPLAQALTDDQKIKIQEILSKYDPENITAEKAKEIFQAFKDAGINPAPGMKEAIEAAGFDAEELRSLARPNDTPPPPPSQSRGINLSTLQELQTILADYDLENLTSEQEKDLYTRLNQAGLMKSGSMLNISA